MKPFCLKGFNPNWEKITTHCVKQSAHKGCKNLIARRDKNEIIRQKKAGKTS